MIITRNIYKFSNKLTKLTLNTILTECGQHFWDKQDRNASFLKWDRGCIYNCFHRLRVSRNLLYIYELLTCVVLMKLHNKNMVSKRN